MDNKFDESLNKVMKELYEQAMLENDNKTIANVIAEKYKIPSATFEVLTTPVMDMLGLYLADTDNLKAVLVYILELEPLGLIVAKTGQQISLILSFGVLKNDENQVSKNLGNQEETYRLN